MCVLSVIVLAGLTAGVAGCASTPSDPEHKNREVEMDQVSFTFSEQEAPFNLFPDYRLAPGDVLDVLYQIKTWKEQEKFVLAVDHEITVKFPKVPELNESERVRPDGKISLPYLGEVYVVGKTVDELTKELESRYSKVLKDVELYVVVPEFRSAIRELKADLHTAPRGLSRLVTVRPDGYCTFGMVGDLFVAGKTVPSVNEVLNERYKEILPGLSVDLFLERHSGSVVYVIGEVDAPGAHNVLKPTSVLEALTLAGGALPTAKLSRVVVVRRHGSKMIATNVDLKKILRLKKGSKFFYLKPDDIVYVPRRLISKWAEIMREISDIVLFNGWGTSVRYDFTPDRRAETTSTTDSQEEAGGRTRSTTRTITVED